MLLVSNVLFGPPSCETRILHVVAEVVTAVGTRLRSGYSSSDDVMGGMVLLFCLQHFAGFMKHFPKPLWLERSRGSR